MPIPDPEHYFDQAEKLTRAVGAPRQADLRRAISAAYYGVFHAVATAAADRWWKQRREPEYAFAYRQIDHGRLKSICNAMRAPLGKEYGRLAGKVFGPELKRFAALVVQLQESRHEADYDPIAKFYAFKVGAAVTNARNATSLFWQAPADERLTFLTLLMFKSRT